ncbi:L-2,4-diaminobutyric acid acetyltransferase [Gordonia araii NBRC 100433]|uniref:L-2,4-diaminobutyric acid acetyltransferase n=1 Tax=Gordonia araii NBRC 100433 TaxID=1073574 RepID=G7H194_9ACTN|nr:diaminobutyrate acetyltransferase [Gordonia araii]NNG96758.1 diaminobutyrate acetyltransferase [Gordonia araii NBRC 100433]GAB09554.1 L-2,4-diaminobutyric acid acetyltransferase [Gordonia araii NBRC 100433]
MRLSKTSATTNTTNPVGLRQPRVADGSRIHRLAAETGVLDTNSVYAYVLWCHDFATTSVVAETDDGELAGFVTGYQRPDDPSVLMVWQVGVDAKFRGQGIAARMLHHLFDVFADAGVRAMHTTISPDNEASQRLFASVAQQRGLSLSRRPLFAAADLGDGHEDEDLYILAP